MGIPVLIWGSEWRVYGRSPFLRCGENLKHYGPLVQYGITDCVKSARVVSNVRWGERNKCVGVMLCGRPTTAESESSALTLMSGVSLRADRPLELLPFLVRFFFFSDGVSN